MYSKCPNKSGQKSLYQLRNGFIIQRAVIRLDHRCDKLYGIMRRVELSLLLGGVDRKFFQEVFVHTTDEVFFLAKLLVADLVDFIDQFF